MSEYRKIMNRSLSLVACQYWEKGEREALLDFCDGVFFEEMLFVFTPGRGVAVYGNYTDPQQDPERLVEYFNTNPKAFDGIRDEYLRRCNELARLTKQIHFSLRTAFDLLISIWPGLAICTVLAKWEGSFLNLSVQQQCVDLREQTERAFYDADAIIEQQTIVEVGEDHVDDVNILTIDEVTSGIYPSKEIVEQRKRGWVYFQGELSTPDSMNGFLNAHEIEIFEEEAIEENEIWGKPAGVGKVRGAVKVVFERSQMGKVKKGDILVASMTTPDFMPAIRLAGALVTDEGGITSHAAIVARELGIPCVVGTKIATKILKDGDMVEVNGETGEIRIIAER